MKTRLLWPFALILALGVVVVDATFYEVNTGQYATVTRFGRVVASRISPGLHVKIPFTDEVHIFDARLLNLRVEPQSLLTKGHKRVLVDAFVEWRIQSFRRYLSDTGGSRHKADERLRQATIAGLRHMLGTHSLQELLDTPRMDKLTERVNREAQRYGLTVAAVRIQRIGLTDHVSDAIEKRMEADQLRRAAEWEATGMAQAQVIRAHANRQRSGILARGYEQAEIIRAHAQAQAGAIYTKAYSAYPQFFRFYKGLRAYVQSFANKHTMLVIGPQSRFLQFLPKHEGLGK